MSLMMRASVLFSTNKYMALLAKNDLFWRERFIKRFGKEYDLTNYLQNDTHRSAYKRLNAGAPISEEEIEHNAVVGMKYGYSPFVYAAFDRVDIEYLAEDAISIKDTKYLGTILQLMPTMPDRLLDKIIHESSIEQNMFEIFVKSDHFDANMIANILQKVDRSAVPLDCALDTLIRNEFIAVLLGIFGRIASIGLYHLPRYSYEVTKVYYKHLSKISENPVIQILRCDRAEEIISDLVPRDKMGFYINNILKRCHYTMKSNLIIRLPDMMPSNILSLVSKKNYGPLGELIVTTLPGDFPYDKNSLLFLTIKSMKILLSKRNIKFKTSMRSAELLQLLVDTL